MKVSVLVAQYFYQHRELNLPGIGTFYLDEAVTIPDISDKNFREFFQYIQFKQKQVTRPDEKFIDYIRTLTGKIKPLAESDLDSYVSDGKFMLNIGKPFHIDGIGTLHKNKEGIYEFTPGEPGMQRMEALGHEKDTDRQNKKRSVFAEDYYPHESKGINMRRVFIGAGVLIGLAVIIWGGYSLYNEKVQPAASLTNNTSIPVTDTTSRQHADSLALAKAAADSLLAASTIPPGNYKFIFETTLNKKRAIRRHKQVNELSSGIQLEAQNDSGLFKIFVLLPASASDTNRIKDSLNTWYYGSRPVKVSIEQ